ncbi:penicillin acylase family protein [Bythopirellula goksoeyrii]|uniref:Glutaryl-7-aminocephalosporanic-acid acylase n=1 Tax=Bythopirellula goksoeyrii TaxID=1400387 RepID=A0A5B9QGV0_9BACT|nr:penicillin acylase family protein [Bythopirellula goksoeyrii]QEG38024.1 Glutaryl-7-aminocephalosporanic-acid acylase precursor [Bythopirellula goksoeyrii]
MVSNWQLYAAPLLLFMGWHVLGSATFATEKASPSLNSRALAAEVTIHRDQYGVPHIIGATDESVIFGYGYAQAEDYFWQLEDSYILALGRYSEVVGPKGLNSDLLNRSFEIVRSSERDFAALDAVSQSLYSAFVAGINFYLEQHPEVRPRLIRHFEPWHVLAYYRHIALELTFRFTGLSDDYMPRRNPQIWAATGSNGWALSGSRTNSGNPLLLANPHMPWFGFAQMFEAHLMCDGSGGGEPWNFTGAGFYGSPVLAMGHNDRLGWTLVTNQPDIADTWRIRFSDPDNPLAYEYDGDWRQAEEWQDTIRVRKSRGWENRQFTFRKTHHGPIVATEEETPSGGRTMLAAQIAGLFEVVPLRQSLRMIKSRNLADFRSALASLQVLYMNVLYADCDGNTWFVYTGRVPRRNPAFDWTQPVEGSDPATEWLGNHGLDELPQVLNPGAGFLQNCNSTPFEVTDGHNPDRAEFPAYMVGDADRRTRRSLRSLEMLRGMSNVTFEEWQQAAFDTEVYWARHELPQFAHHLEQLSHDNSQLAKRVQPYLDHLLAWDARITADSTAASLCHEWYEQLYGITYPGEEMRSLYQDKPAKQLEALARAADRLQSLHGTWQVPYGELYRIQRPPQIGDLTDARFEDLAPSLTSLGGHGPMGVIFTQYYTPSLQIPWVISQRKRYGIVGTSYMAAWDFTPEGVRGASLVPFGTSGDPDSPHYFDQAELLSGQRMKPELFTKDEVRKAAAYSYHPGEDY